MSWKFEHCLYSICTKTFPYYMVAILKPFKEKIVSSKAWPLKQTTSCKLSINHCLMGWALKRAHELQTFSKIIHSSYELSSNQALQVRAKEKRAQSTELSSNTSLISRLPNYLMHYVLQWNDPSTIYHVGVSVTLHWFILTRSILAPLSPTVLRH